MIELKITADSAADFKKQLEALMSGFNKEQNVAVEVTAEPEPSIDHDFKLPHRNKKGWTEFELNFLTEHYQSKNIKWIAGKLKRKPQTVYVQLTKMYALGLKKKNNRVKNIVE